jgi:putative addiction module component (TIGR02574 family)
MANLNEMDATLLGLPTDERARLAQLLLLSLDEQLDDNVEEAWKAEAERRFREYKNGLVETIDGQEAMREARQALR